MSTVVRLPEGIGVMWNGCITMSDQPWCPPRVACVIFMQLNFADRTKIGHRYHIAYINDKGCYETMWVDEETLSVWRAFETLKIIQHCSKEVTS